VNLSERRRGPLPVLSVVLLAACALASCKSRPREQAAKPAPVHWQRVGSWSGHGDAQTESFDIGYEQCRVQWETKNETSPGTGTFELTLNSAVSGRALQPLADHPGTGRGMAYTSIEPHFSYLVISSKNVDWTVTVEEPALVTPR